jgi:nucleotide-binding universal stress UspA family protein
LKEIPFEEWKAKRENGFDLGKEINGNHDSDDTSNEVELKTNTILESERIITKNTNNILMTENVNSCDLEKMKKLNIVNCLHKGNFNVCFGRRIMVAVDGSPSAHRAFESALKMIDRFNDHLFIVTSMIYSNYFSYLLVRERIVLEFYQERSRIIITHKVWQAAAEIINKYQDILNGKGIEYTSIMPEADDAREMLCKLAKKYNADILIVGKHKKHETKKKSPHFRSFAAYCQKNAKTSVLVY